MDKKMITAVVPVHVAPHQIEGFPETVSDGADANGKAKHRPFERSAEGALHIRPGSTLQLTEDELGFMKQHHKQLVGRLAFHATMPAKATKPTKAETSPTEPAPAPTSDEKPKKK